MDRIKKILDIAKEKQSKDFDTVFLIVGNEGSGKSHLLLNCVDYLGVTEIDNIALDQKQFVEALSKSKDAGIVSFDEAGDGLFSRDFASKTNKDLVKTFMIIRAKRLITFLVLPSFFMIDTYFRRHRVKGLFYVYKRGLCMFFSKKKIEKLTERNAKSQKIKGVRPAFYDNYPEYKGHLLPEYKIKKMIKVTETLMNLEKDEK